MLGRERLHKPMSNDEDPQILLALPTLDHLFFPQGSSEASCLVGLQSQTTTEEELE